MIDVRRTGEGDPLEFEVVVREGKGETRHHVTMAREACQRLTAGKHTPERVSRRPSDSCSIASRRSPSSAGST